MEIRKSRTVCKRYFILPMLAMLFMMSATVYASSESAAVQIPIKQIFTVKQGAVPNGGDVFYYKLTPLQADSPLPEGSKDGTYSFSMKDAQEGKLPEITYTRVGEYEYQIQQVTAQEKEGYGYDKKTYTVAVSIRAREENGFVADLILKNEAGEKVETVLFENTYTGKKVSVKPGSNTTPPSYTTSSSQSRPMVKTGDETKLTLFIALLAGSLLMVIILAGVKRKKKGNA